MTGIPAVVSPAQCKALVSVCSSSACQTRSQLAPIYIDRKDLAWRRGGGKASQATAMFEHLLGLSLASRGPPNPSPWLRTSLVVTGVELMQPSSQLLL